MIRAVLDTNVIISALITKRLSPPREIYQAFKHQHFLLVKSIPILEEVEEVLNREKLVRLHYLSEVERHILIEELVALSYIVPGKTSVSIIKDDPDDNKFLACALEGKTDYIVTGDIHLLHLRKFQKIKIVSPKNFLESLSKVR